MPTLIQFLKWMAGIIIGYVTIIIFALIFQDALFGGLKVGESAFYELLIGGGLTAVGAFLGGYLLAWVAAFRPFIPATVLSLILMTEGTYLYLSGITTGPLFFELAAVMSLVLGVWLGCYLRVMRTKKG